MTLFRRSFTALIVLLFVATTLYAQGGQQQQPAPATPDSVTDKELKKFADAANAAQSIQSEIQKDVQKLVEEEGMEFARFQKIMMSKQNPQMSGQVEVSKEEEQTIQKIQPDLMKITQGLQQDIVKAIQDEGLTTQRYQEIMRAVQMNPELANRLQELQNEDQNQNN